MDAEELISRVATWARDDDRVVAAAVCGSHARGEARPDSDIDLCLVCTEPAELLDRRSWIQAFGPDARVAGPVEDYNLVQSIRVFYGSTEVEFGVTHPAWMDLPLDRGTADVINNGLRILYDPEGRLEEAVAFAATTGR